MKVQSMILMLLKGSIVLTVLGFGLQATRDDLLYLLRRPRILAASLMAMFVIMPLFAILVTKFISFRPAVVIALIALSISPVPPLLPKRVTKAGGLAPYGLGLMVTAASFSIVYIPLVVHLLGKYFDRPFAMRMVEVAKLVLFSVWIPLALGIVFQRLAPTAGKSLAPHFVRIAGIVLVICAAIILAFSYRSVWALVGNGTILGFVAFVIVGIAVGHVLGGPDPDRRVTLALSTACRHPALALAIATVNIPNEHRVLSAILLYLILNIVFSIPYVAWQRKAARALAGNAT